MFKVKAIFFISILFLVTSCEIPKNNVSEEVASPKKSFNKGYRFEKNGWTYVHIEGAPYERGMQYGYLVAEEYKKAIYVYKKITFEATGMDYSFFVEKGDKKLLFLRDHSNNLYEIK